MFFGKKIDRIKYDTDIMRNTSQKYKECSEIMNEIKEGMQDMADSLRDSWKSEAGEAFFEKYDDEWLKSFVHYKEVLDHMAENLDYATGQYSSITSMSKNIKL